MKKVNIKYKTIKVPIEIKIDNKVYPNNQLNWDVIKEYEKTKNEKVLDKLIDFSLDL